MTPNNLVSGSYHENEIAVKHRRNRRGGNDSKRHHLCPFALLHDGGVRFCDQDILIAMAPAAIMIMDKPRTRVMRSFYLDECFKI